ncbi:MAG TPA: CHRD domain-containing protein [Gaiellaceae bacterium]|nr:CHRD domain-containing protein [Gaiellaceae bacterium]
MQRTALMQVAAAAAAVTLAATLGASARPQATTIQVRTTMDAAQEVPAPSGDVAGARGTFSATVTRSGTGASVSWQMSFSGLTGNAVAAHIHQAAAGSSGPVVLPLCAPCQSSASGTGNLPEAALDALEAGNTYVNIHTPTNPAGEIRGQLAITAAVSTTLDARQERPRPRGNVRRARGTFTATFAKLGTSGTMTWRLRFSGLTGRAVAAHLHAAPRGRPGPVLVPLCGPCRNGARGTATLQPAALAALESGRAYVNVHTPRNQAGEIRGQIRPVPLSID